MVNGKLWTGIALASALCGCDLEEAERMDLSRRGATSVESRFEGVRYQGSSEIPLTRLLKALMAGEASRALTFVWEDAGTRPLSGLLLSAHLDSIELFECFPTDDRDLAGKTRIDAPIETWIDRGEGVRFVLLARDEAGVYQPTALDPRLRIVDDRPHLEWSGVPDSGWEVRRGDTLAIEVRNPGSDTLEVFDEHAGMRTIGDYLVKLAPGESTRRRWLVTARTGEDVWIDLQWGEWGNSHRLTFGSR